MQQTVEFFKALRGASMEHMIMLAALGVAMIIAVTLMSKWLVIF